ncbi:hypothetical protein ASPWEDRAFT_177517 [Aspergillus wentii DTO 134E9]|uniref:NWD NACHT-NTPase N-terminal domain-containing protein n=1 Tax=Aspergillus wentii DTO 134E9 TaxID=1073089 RepID=A0A1L9R4C7_ASPWE|nr:uncharacterized protein ASPWEDRAFT_177517 [Aspergillus wentii DTO 134E9]OJJ29775.1 hypothetical protein ASPWEDRAFT_177517 [Aspergillus wentii DTO 134E9]
MALCNCFQFLKRKGKRKVPTSAVNDRQKHSESSSAGLQSAPASVEEKPQLAEKEDTHEDLTLVAKEIWDDAYDELRNDASKKELVDEYEKILRSQLRDLRSDSQRALNSDDSDGNEKGNIASDLARLDKKDRQALVDALVEKGLEETNKSSTGREIISIVSSSIQKTKAIVDSAVSACPPASIAWAATCLIVVPVIVNNVEQTDANQAGLNYVISILPWYTQLIDLLDADAWNSPEKFHELKSTIRKEIVKLYKLLIEYQLRSVRAHHSKTTIARNIVKWDDWAKMIQDIKDAEQQLNGYISTYHKVKFQHKFDAMGDRIQEIRDILSLSSQEQTDILKEIRDSNNNQSKLMEQNAKAAISQRRKEIVDKFKPDPSHLDLDIYASHISQISSPHDGTGQGVLHHSKFKQWSDAERGILVLTAHPGTGKSVLAKHLLEELPKYKPTSICSFFFMDRTGHTNPRTALCKIIYELLKQCSTLDAVSDRADRLDTHDIQLDSRKFWSLFNAAVQDTSHGSVVVVLDALDECDHDQVKPLIKALRNYHSSFPTSRVRFLLTTRPLPDILQEFEEASIMNWDDDPGCRESLSRDIADVTNFHIEKLSKDKDIDEDTQQELLDRLEAGRDRTYLFVQLLFDYLERQGRQVSSEDWLDIFQTLPDDLPSTYGAFLRDVRKNNHFKVRTMLKIVLAAARPLTLREMNIALILHLKDYSSCQTEDQMKLQSPESFKKWIFEACGFCFDIYNDRIYFIHQTVKDYLLSSEFDDQVGWLGDFSIKSCEQTIAKSCIKYLSLSFIKEGKFMSVQECIDAPSYTMAVYHQWCTTTFAFGDYAFSKWIIHLINSHGPEESQEQTKTLTDMVVEYPEMPVDLAVSIFCCSTLASHIEAKAFVGFLPSEYPDRIDILSALGQSLITRIENMHGGTADLEYGVTLAEQVREQTPDDHPKFAKRLAILSMGLRRKATKVRDPLILEQAIQVAEEAVAITPPGHPDRPRTLHTRACAFNYQFRDDKRMEDINQAIDDSVKAVECTPAQDPDRPLYLCRLACYLSERYDITEEMEDLDEATRLAEEAIDALPEGHPREYQVLDDLSNVLMSKCYMTDNVDDTNWALEVMERCLTLSVNFSIRLSFLQKAAYFHFLHQALTKEKHDLDRAVAAVKEALDATPSGDINQASVEGLYTRLRRKQGHENE